MTDYTIPPNQTKVPLILNAGDTLSVYQGGRSTDVTVNDGATEFVEGGGSSFRTTVNEGQEQVNGGTADITTINWGLSSPQPRYSRSHEAQFSSSFSVLPIGC